MPRLCTPKARRAGNEHELWWKWCVGANEETDGEAGERLVR